MPSTESSRDLSRQIEMESAQENKPFADLAAFLIPSLLGIGLFIVPIPHGTGLQVPIALVAKFFQQSFEHSLRYLAVAIPLVSAVLSLCHRALPHRISGDLFAVSVFWRVTRVLGAVIAAAVTWQVGPSWLWSERTGGLLMTELVPVLITVFVLAGFLLPFLVSFGLLEFCGALLSRFMTKIFGLPGRSAVDCLASWVGDGAIGVLLTSKQYEGGYYTARQACTIGTCFSFVSVTFCTVVLSYADIEHMVVQYYSAIVVGGVLCAIILPKIPPLSLKPNRFIDGTEDVVGTDVSAPIGWRRGLELAVDRARGAADLRKFVFSGGSNVAEMLFGVVPVVIAFGTVALIVAEFTPVLGWFGRLLQPYVELFGVDSSADVSEALVVGFADMLLPTILISENGTEQARFIVATMSVSQLLFMSETGSLLISSKIPVTFRDVLVLYVLRTLICLPIVVLFSGL